MASGVTVRRNFGRLEREVKLSDRTLMREIGLLAKERIVRRTLAGRDEDNAPFRPYSAAYQVQKQRHLGAAGTPNLQVSGEMLGAITIIDLGDDFVTLGFSR